MAIKFFFRPIAQSVTQVVSTLQSGQTSKSEIINYAKTYFKNNLTLPVNPQTLEITTASDNKKTNVVKLGQIVIPKGVNLSTLTIESFFPGGATSTANILGNFSPSYLVTSLDSLFNSFTSKQYFQYFETLQQTQIPVRLVISDCGVDMDVLVESIKQKYESCDDDLYYTLNLIQYKPHKATKLETKAVSTSEGVVQKVIPTVKPRTKTGLASGDTVIVNGKYFYDSFGSSPSNSFKNFKGKISHVATNKNASYKYHITSMDGGWKGWVKADQIQGVD